MTVDVNPKPEPNTNQIADKLARHEFLSGVDEKHIETLAAFTHQEIIDAGDYVFRAGEHAEHCYLILEGRVYLEVYDPRRGAVALESLGSNRALGWSWLIPPHQWTFDARATVPTGLLALNAEKFRRAMESDHELGYHMLKRFTSVIADRLRASRLQLLDMYGPVA